MPGRRVALAGGRDVLAAVLVGAVVVLAVVALVLTYGGRALLRAGPFADRAVAALRDPSVEQYVADRVTDAVVQAGSGDAVVVRPVVRAVAGGIVGGGAFAALFRRGVLNAHIAVVEGQGSTVVVRVADVGVLVQGLVERFAPGAAQGIGTQRAATLLSWRPGGGVLELMRIARRVASIAWLPAVLAVLAAAGALGISPSRRRTGQQLGLGLVLGGLAVVAVVTVGRAVTEQAAPAGAGDAVGALWWSFFGGLRVQALVLAAAGAICAAAAGRVHLVGLAEVRGRVVSGSLSPRARRVRGGGLIVVGVAILLEPAAALTVAALALGLYAVAAGVGETIRATVFGARSSGDAGRALRARVLRFVPAVIAFAAVVIAFDVIATGGGDEAPSVVPLTCNGYVVLCSRPLNDVAFAATHNSYGSVTIPTFLFGQQDGTIADQLQDGVRGLLIDTYYGSAFPRGVRTDLERLPKAEIAVRELGAPAVEAALRIRARLGSEGEGKPGIFLCHGFCEIGAVSFASALADLRFFLVSHPDAVVIVINQDEGVAPTDIERAFDDAGLLDFVYRGPLGPFPTLRALIDSGQRLVVMAENDAGSVPWYHLAYQNALQETPFRFTSADELTDSSKLAASCRSNRGPASAPLFLLNNWVDTTPVPRPSLATIVNARSVLLTRAETCMHIRHRLPNLVAVDFYRRGDLLGVVNALNRVDQ
ncbi:MAG: hypothetical protein ACLP8S_04630 [Solirubrobacteraceae bacterium]